MRTHTTRGEEICRHVKSLSAVLPIIRHHHERWDGSGYPDGLKGKQIPLLARVLQVADIYDALTNPRPYRQACTAAKALEIVREECARGWRDPEVVGVFLTLHNEVFGKAFEENGAPRAGSVGTSLANLDRALREAFAPGDAALLPISLQ
jgi:putative two-component system response regulator